MVQDTSLSQEIYVGMTRSNDVHPSFDDSNYRNTLSIDMVVTFLMV